MVHALQPFTSPSKAAVHEISFILMKYIEGPITLLVLHPNSRIYTPPLILPSLSPGQCLPPPFNSVKIHNTWGEIVLGWGILLDH